MTRMVKEISKFFCVEERVSRRKSRDNELIIFRGKLQICWEMYSKALGRPISLIGCRIAPIRFKNKMEQMFSPIGSPESRVFSSISPCVPTLLICERISWPAIAFASRWSADSVCPISSSEETTSCTTVLNHWPKLTTAIWLRMNRIKNFCTLNIT